METQSRDDFAASVQDVLADHGVIGFDLNTDAIRQPSTSGPRYYYVDDGEIRWTSQFAHGGNTWRSPATMELDRFTEVLEAVDEFDVVSREAFDYFSELDVEGVHDGLCWGIASIYGEDRAHESPPDRWSLKSVPGIGDTLGSRIVQAMDD